MQPRLKKILTCLAALWCGWLQAYAAPTSCLASASQTLDGGHTRNAQLAVIDKFLAPIKYFETRVRVGSSDAKKLTEASRYLANLNGSVYRGEFLNVADLGHYKTGAIIRDPDATLASLSSIAAEMPVANVPQERVRALFEIHSRTGKELNAFGIKNRTTKKDVLFLPDSVFKVKSISKYDGQVHIVLEQL